MNFSRNEEDQKARITPAKCTDGSGCEQGKCAPGPLLSTPFVSDTIPALKRKDRMSEETPTQPFSGGEQPQQQQIQVMLDEREMRTIYSNAYRFHTTADEVVLDVGFNMPNPNPNPQGSQGQQLLFKVTERIIMTYPNAKRLAGSLTQLVTRYEQQFGPIAAPGGQRR